MRFIIQQGYIKITLIFSCNISLYIFTFNCQVRDAVREVVATYSIDEGSMELVVSLPSNYPLGGLNVDSGKRVGVETGNFMLKPVFRIRSLIRYFLDGWIWVR